MGVREKEDLRWENGSNLLLGSELLSPAPDMSLRVTENSERRRIFLSREITEAPRAQVHHPRQVAALTAAASRQHLALMHSLVLKPWSRARHGPDY